MTDIEKQAREEFETDGTVVRGKDGYCMGIFSTVSYLNDRLAEIEKLQAEKKKLRDCLELFLEDYDKKDFTYGWQDLMARKFKQCLKELEE